VVWTSLLPTLEESIVTAQWLFNSLISLFIEQA
jgi:hypothetical protein